jgi:hypothetical protein
MIGSVLEVIGGQPTALVITVVFIESKHIDSYFVFIDLNAICFIIIAYQHLTFAQYQPYRLRNTEHCCTSLDNSQQISTQYVADHYNRQLHH